MPQAQKGITMPFLVIVLVIIIGVLYYVRKVKQNADIGNDFDGAGSFASSDETPCGAGRREGEENAGGEMKPSAFPVFNSMEELDAFYKREAERLSGEQDN